MTDNHMPLVGDHPDHGPVPPMPPHQPGFRSMPESVLSGPFSQHGAVQEPYRHASASTQGSLMSWFENGPWVPPNCATGFDGRSASRMNGTDPATYSFAFPGQYRNAPCVPSECGTAPTGIELSDSGYGSNVAKYSIANTSVLEEPLDQCPETQSLAGRFSDFNFNFDTRQASMWQPQPSVDYRSSSHLDAKGLLVCGTCNKQVKTRSELKKHQQRHTKPHRCQVPGCSRIEGFSTTNDLDRHTRSVHPNEVVAGNRYQCTIGSCKSKDKSWPRADNFRAHLKRVHGQTDVGDEALELYICRPHQLAQDEPMDDNISHQLPPQYSLGARQLGPDLETGFAPSLLSQSNEQVTSSSEPEPYNGMALSTAPVGSSHMDLGHMTGGTGSVDHVMMSPSEDGGLSMPDLEDMSSAVQTSQSAPNCLPVAMDPVGQPQLQFVVPRDLSQRNCTPGFPASAAIKSAQSIFESPGVPLQVPATASPASLTDDEPDASDTNGVIVLDVTSDRRLQDDASKEPERTAPVGQTGALLQLDMSDNESVRRAVEALASSGKLEALGFRKDLPTPADKTEDSTARLRQEHQHPCLAENCDKTFARPCELKKHAKRHSKPYRCTYPGCPSRFGSKNDWKRHENGQHFLLEVWKCEEPRTKQSSERCGRISHRRETFKDHLTKSHGLHGHDLENKLEECRAGRSFVARSWCGFCEKIVETPQKGAAWAERFNHIDDHIHGRNGFSKKNMDEWKYLDPNVSQPLYPGSDTDDDDGLREAPPDSARLTEEPQQGYSRNTVASKRRTTDIEPDERQNKRARRDQPLMSGVITCVSQPLPHLAPKTAETNSAASAGVLKSTALQVRSA